MSKFLGIAQRRDLPQFDAGFQFSRRRIAESGKDITVLLKLKINKILSIRNSQRNRISERSNSQVCEAEYCRLRNSRVWLRLRMMWLKHWNRLDAAPWYEFDARVRTKYIVDKELACSIKNNKSIPYDVEPTRTSKQRTSEIWAVKRRCSPAWENFAWLAPNSNGSRSCSRVLESTKMTDSADATTDRSSLNGSKEKSEIRAVLLMDAMFVKFCQNSTFEPL